MARTTLLVGVVVTAMLALCDSAMVGRKTQQTRNTNNPYAILNNGPMADKYQSYSILSQNSTYDQLRRYPAGKWIKIKTRPFLGEFYYKEIQDYINGNNSQNLPMALGAPMVIRFDLNQQHALRFARYQQLRQQAMQYSKRINNGRSGRQPTPVQGGKQSQAAKSPEQIILANLTDSAYSQLLDLVSNNQATVYSFLNKAYHLNPPLPKNPDLSIVTTSDFEVYSRGYFNRRGLEDSYEVAHSLASTINRPLTTYFLADYMYWFTGVRRPYYYEVWMSRDPTKPALS